MILVLLSMSQNTKKRVERIQTAIETDVVTQQYLKKTILNAVDKETRILLTPSEASPDVGGLMRVHSASALKELRNKLTSFIWKDSPTYNRKPGNVDPATDVSRTFSQRSRLIEKLTVPMEHDVVSYPYYFQTKSRTPAARERSKGRPHSPADRRWSRARVYQHGH